MTYLRQISMPWTQRNIARMTRWFKLEYDFAGNIIKGGKLVGYKTCGRHPAFSPGTIVYNFYGEINYAKNTPVH